MSPQANPPRWAESLLARLLDERNRETVIGDLHEEFIECALPMMGPTRARLWYVRQAASFIPISLKENTPMKKLLMLVSFFTLVCAGWLVLMEALLRHQGFAGRIALAASIAVISVATIVARLLRASYRVERWLWVGATALIAIGVQAFIHNALSAHFEGFVFIISLLLVFNGALMFAALGRACPQPLQPATRL